MITDGEFSALIAEAAETIPEPTGADAILAAARSETDPPSVAAPIAKVRRHPRGFVISVLGAAAVLAILIAVTLSSSSSPPSVAHSAGAPFASRASAAPTFGEGQMSAPGVTKSADSSSASSTSSADSQEIITTGTLSLVVHERVLGHVVAELRGDRDVAGRVRLDLQCGPCRLQSWWHRGARSSRWRIPKKR